MPRSTPPARCRRSGRWRPISRAPEPLFDQPLSGKGKLAADATHVTASMRAWPWARTRSTCEGAFGKPGERLAWRLDGRQLAALRRDLYGAVQCERRRHRHHGAPRTTFVVDANGLGWVAPSARTTTAACTPAAKPGSPATKEARFVEAKASGDMQRLNPAAFGSPLAGSINGAFDASGRTGANWAARQPDAAGIDAVEIAAVGLCQAHGRQAPRVERRRRPAPGRNVVAAKGAFGSGATRLELAHRCAPAGRARPRLRRPAARFRHPVRHHGHALADGHRWKARTCA
jgi:translocation and assembly module TamB